MMALLSRFNFCWLTGHAWVPRHSPEVGRYTRCEGCGRVK